jgi:hypothetical protein
MQWARACYRSAAGLFESGWRFDDTGHLIIEITIPFNASAKVVLPTTYIDEISINDTRLYEGKQTGDSVVLTLGAGSYKISYLFQQGV